MYTEAPEDHFNHDLQQYLANEHGEGLGCSIPSAIQYRCAASTEQVRSCHVAKTEQNWHNT